MSRTGVVKRPKVRGPRLNVHGSFWGAVFSPDARLNLIRFAAGEYREGRLPCLQIELELGLLSGLRVTDAHVSQLPLPFDFLEAPQGKLLQELVRRVVGLGQDHSACFVIDPREN